MKCTGCSGFASKRLRSCPTKLSTVRTEPDRLAPHQVEQLRAREHLRRMTHEEREQLELEVRELDLDVGARDHALREIDRDVVEAHHRAGRWRHRVDHGCGRRRAGAPQHGLDACEQLGERERLGDVVVGTQAQRRDLIELAVARGQHDHRHDVVGGAHLGEHLEAVLARQVDVEQHEIDLGLEDDPQAVFAIARDRRRVAGELEVERQPGRDRVVVFDDQDAAAHAMAPAPADRAATPTSCGPRRSLILNSVWPGRECTSILPRWPRTIARTNARPKPIPGVPESAVARPRANCSNTSRCSSRGMPMPLSRTTSSTLRPAARAITLICLSSPEYFPAQLVEQVRDRAHQRRAVADHAEVGLEVADDRRRPRQRRRIEHRDRIVDDIGDIDAFAREDVLARRQPLEIEQAADEMLEALGLAAEQRQHLLAIGGLEATIAQRLDEQLDRGQRRAQLVRHARHEVVLDADERRPAPDEHRAEDVAGHDAHAQREHEDAEQQRRRRLLRDDQQDPDAGEQHRRHQRRQHQHELRATQLQVGRRETHAATMPCRRRRARSRRRARRPPRPPPSRPADCRARDRAADAGPRRGRPRRARAARSR